MINFNKLINIRKTLLRKFIKPDYKTAIDIGCGTGVDSIALAMNGLQVKGYDTSEKMIKKARANAKTNDVKITFINSTFNSKTITQKSNSDFIISSGNAFANIETKELNSILKSVHKSLNKGGIFLFQVLNYDLIRKEEKRIVNITESINSIFVRFYDFEEEIIRFNILTFNKLNPKEYSLITTEIYEHSKTFFLNNLLNIGFKNIKIYGDFNCTIYNKRKSKDLIILANK